jgi:hypothetical protein
MGADDMVTRLVDALRDSCELADRRSERIRRNGPRVRRDTPPDTLSRSTTAARLSSFAWTAARRPAGRIRWQSGRTSTSDSHP